jgi:hypothetical protein
VKKFSVKEKFLQAAHLAEFLLHACVILWFVG